MKEKRRGRKGGERKDGRKTPQNKFLVTALSLTALKLGSSPVPFENGTAFT